jgi:hypothetical protein
MWPSLGWITPWTTARPRPVPSPGPFVVKKALACLHGFANGDSLRRRPPPAHANACSGPNASVPSCMFRTLRGSIVRD